MVRGRIGATIHDVLDVGQKVRGTRRAMTT
jgi:hypothetical protein